MNKQTELIDVTESTKKKPPVKSKSVTVQKKEIAVQSESAALLKLAIDKDLDVDKLEKLIDLKVREEARQCKKDFELHFSKMKAELPIIEKTEEVTDDKGNHMYNFAPLAEIQTLCDPTIAKYKFSYYWDESYISETKSKRVTFYLSGYGHTKSNYFDVADIQSNKWANAIQTGGIKSSYGNRYTFCSGLGLIIKGVDTDGIHLTFDDGVQYSKQVDQINNCNTKEELIETWKSVWKNLGTDTIGKQILTIVYNKRKGAIK